MKKMLERKRTAVRGRLAARSLVLCACLGLVACGNFRRGRDCKRFIETINASVGQIDAEPLSENTDVATVVKEARRLALDYQRLATTIGSLKLKSPEVRSRAEDYHSMAERAALVLRDVALAVERMDSSTAQRKRLEFGSMEQEEKRLVERIDRLCHPQ
jgi:hypothetical protein